MRLWKRFKEIHRRPELAGAGTLGEVAADHQEVVPPGQQVFGGRGDGGGVFGAEVDVADMGNPPHGGIIQASAEGQSVGKRWMGGWRQSAGLDEQAGPGR